MNDNQEKILELIGNLPQSMMKDLATWATHAQSWEITSGGLSNKQRKEAQARMKKFGLDLQELLK